MCAFGHFCKNVGINETMYRESGEQQGTEEDHWDINLVVN